MNWLQQAVFDRFANMTRMQVAQGEIILQTFGAQSIQIGTIAAAGQQGHACI